MPFYTNSNGYWVRLNLNSASTLFQPSDSSGKTCNLNSSGAATNFYANDTRIYGTASWTTIWSGSVPIQGTLGVDYTTTISGITFPANVYNYRIVVLRQVGTTQNVAQNNLPVNVSGTIVQQSYRVQIKSFTVNTSAGTFAVVSQLTQGSASGAAIQKIEAYV